MLYDNLVTGIRNIETHEKHTTKIDILRAVHLGAAGEGINRNMLCLAATAACCSLFDPFFAFACAKPKMKVLVSQKACSCNLS